MSNGLGGVKQFSVERALDSNSYFINISDPPTQPVSSSVQVSETQQAIFNCLLTPQHPSSPETIRYTWTKGSQDIGFNNQTTGRMVTNNVNRTQAGTYTCTVCNVADQNSLQKFLTKL